MTSISRVAKLICESKSIIVLIGAGVSVSCGIPDFRSAGGMYDTLQPGLLTATTEQRNEMKADPTYVVSWELFHQNPLPYLELRRPFILGLAEKKWKPSLTHHFIALLGKHKKLTRLYSQNIDGLEYDTCLDKSKIISCHGSLSTISCEYCDKTYPKENFIQQLTTNIRDIYNPSITKPITKHKLIICENCNQAGVKPTTVLYGRSLPRQFHTTLREDSVENKIDLIITIGTSLEVGPANSVPNIGDDCTKRIFINLEDYPPETKQFLKLDPESGKDIVIQDKSDDLFREVVKAMGSDFTEEFENLMAS